MKLRRGGYRYRASLLCGLALLFAGSMCAADVTGKWTFHVKWMLHKGDPWFQFQQTGEKLAGMYHGYFGDLPLVGTVKGDQLVFTITSDRGSGTYTGTLSGDTIKGVAKYPFPLGSGKFEGKRDK